MDKQAYELHYKVCEKLLRAGADKMYIVRRMQFKLGLDSKHAKYIVKRAEERLYYKSGYTKADGAAASQRWREQAAARSLLELRTAEHLQECVERLGPKILGEAALIEWAADRGVYLGGGIWPTFHWSITAGGKIVFKG